MSGLSRKLTALEQVAEDVRQRNMRDELRDIMTRRARLHGWAPPSEEAVSRAMSRALEVERWLAEGLCFEDAARLIARDNCLDPDRVIEIYREIKAAEAG